MSVELMHTCDSPAGSRGSSLGIFAEGDVRFLGLRNYDAMTDELPKHEFDNGRMNGGLYSSQIK